MSLATGDTLVVTSEGECRCCERCGRWCRDLISPDGRKPPTCLRATVVGYDTTRVRASDFSTGSPPGPTTGVVVGGYFSYLTGTYTAYLDETSGCCAVGGLFSIYRPCRGNYGSFQFVVQGNQHPNPTLFTPAYAGGCFGRWAGGVSNPDYAPSAVVEPCGPTPTGGPHWTTSAVASSGDFTGASAANVYTYTTTAGGTCSPWSVQWKVWESTWGLYPETVGFALSGFSPGGRVVPSEAPQLLLDVTITECGPAVDPDPLAPGGGGMGMAAHGATIVTLPGGSGPDPGPYLRERYGCGCGSGLRPTGR